MEHRKFAPAHSPHSYLNLILWFLVWIFVDFVTPQCGRGDERGQNYPERVLRGFGIVSGQSTEQTLDSPASHLFIRCESESKSKLTLAKFLSDLRVLPGTKDVEIPLGSEMVKAVEVADQGYIATVRINNEVHIYASRSKRSLQQAIAKQLKTK